MSGIKKSKQILVKAGWEEGKGLGRSEQGDVEHVKVKQKDGMLGIGYSSDVAGQQVWSQQAVEFADVLARINQPSTTAADGDDEDDDQPLQRKTNGPAAGKHAVAYNKRRNLKTEGLTSAAGKAEIIGRAAASASTAKRRGRDSDSNSDDDSDAEDGKKKKSQKTVSALKSPLLLRMCERVGQHEPKKRNPEEAIVTIKMPEDPKKCTETPFNFKRE